MKLLKSFLYTCVTLFSVYVLGQDDESEALLEPIPMAEAPKEAAAPKPAPAAKAKLTKKQSSNKNKKKSKKKKIAKKKTATKSKKVARKISSIDEPTLAVVVFSENQNFESMVSKKIEDDRTLASQEVSARVIGVRRELGLTEAESARAPQNIIINGGTSNGFEKGMVITVTRKIPVIDPYRENKQSELEIEFATAKIIQASDMISVAKIQKITDIQSGLYVGTRGILIGDFVK